MPRVAVQGYLPHSDGLCIWPADELGEIEFVATLAEASVMTACWTILQDKLSSGR